MGTLKDALSKLLARRETLVAEIEAIDRELAEVGIRGDPRVPKMPAYRETAAACGSTRTPAQPPSGRRHDSLKAREQAEADVLLALKTEPLSGANLERRLNWPRHVIMRALNHLLELHRVVRTGGPTGRLVRWSLPLPARGRQNPPESGAQELQPVWPFKDDPKAGVSELHERMARS